VLSTMEKLIEEMAAEHRVAQERSWIEALHKEYNSICWQYGVKLRPVVLCLTEATSTWGRWDNATRSLEISRTLILKKNWDQVVGILKHEMAHQIVDELMGGNDIHGEKFNAACELLALPEEFRRARIPLNDALAGWRDSPNTTSQDALLRRVEKLMSLAQSSNENEAALAMQKVHELFLKHNLERAKSRITSRYVTLTINTKKKRVDRAQSIIAGIINEHYFVRVIYSSLFNAQTCESHKTIEVIGTQENVLMAEYVFHFLEHSIQSLWEHYKKNGNTGQGTKNSYQAGLLTGFSRKLRRAEKREEVTPTQAVLIKTLDKSLDGHVRALFPKLTGRSHSGRCADADSFHAGCSDGEKIVLHRGIKDKKESKRTLLLS
jgi:hypothetical protein